MFENLAFNLSNISILSNKAVTVLLVTAQLKSFAFNYIILVAQLPLAKVSIMLA